MNDKGTTLTELLVVLAIVGVATTITAQSLLGAVPKSHRFSTTAEFAVELRTAHRLAIKQRRAVRVVMDETSATLRIEEADEARAVLRRYEYVPHGIRSIALSHGNSIVFYPSGRSATPVTVTLTTVRGETSKVTVTITGKVNWS